jgi:hypothetical protein
MRFPVGHEVSRGTQKGVKNVSPMRARGQVSDRGPNCNDQALVIMFTYYVG